MAKLAINGGEPIRTELFPNQACIGYEEASAAQRVMESQMLSGYRGNWQKYRGGTEVQKFEEMWKERFQHKHAIAVNSCTSALHVACLAIGLKPGNEVIVTPYSMACSATAPMLCGATPVFADVERDYFCLDVESVESKITEHTKAIIAVDLFGQPFDKRLIAFAQEKGIYLIEDAAQAPGAWLMGNPENLYTGDLGDIGCFSFTQGKHMTAGEGGMITAIDDELAERCRLIINHAEAVINDAEMNLEHRPVLEKHKELWGMNLRMTEIQAAILQEQLKKLDFFIGKRNENADYLAVRLNNIPFITPAPIRESCTHTFYVQAFFYDQDYLELHRDRFLEAVKAELQPMRGRESEGVRIGGGYIKPIYRMPLFDDRFKNPDKEVRYHSIGADRFIKPLPVVEKLWKDDLFLHLYLAPPTNRGDLDDIINAFEKVTENVEELR